ncbi:MAG: ABC transporter substrate-binding protein [Gemmatimonas sp.]
MFRTPVFAVIAAALVVAATPVRADDNAPAMKELIKAAQAEGSVEVLLSGQVPAKLRPLMPEFTKRYGVKINFQVGGGDQNGQRILAERRVGRYTLDAWLGGANTALAQLVPNNALVPINDKLVDPDVTDLSKWYRGRHYYVDPDQKYILAFGAQPARPISYNTKLLDPEQIKSYEDLLDPKWKGKQVAWNPSMEGAAATTVALYLHPRVGEAWFTRWARDMKVTLIDDVRQGAEWVALGRFPIGLFGIATQAEKMSREGFPIRGDLPHPMAEGEVLTSSATNIMLMDRAPHPKAGQLFANWILTREVQQEIVKLSRTTDSLREDIDDSMLSPQYQRRHDVDYFIAFADHRYQTEQTQIMARLREIMKEAGYR